MITGIKFTPKEFEILKLISLGISRKDIAAELKMSVRTYDTHLKSIFQKTGIHEIGLLIVWCGKQNFDNVS